METYATALLYAIPMFSLLVIFEVVYGYFKDRQTHHPLDTISSLSSGMTNIIKDSLGVVVVIISYPFLYDALVVTQVENTFLTYLLAFLAIDFASYWVHRISHRVNFFWNQHVIHHSSEEFNLACALRQSISNLIAIYPLFLIPAAFLGVPHQVIATIAPVHLFLQFWYHTKHIPKLGFLEYIIVTPSQHRVHHAINPEYIDKNLAAIFCIWDRAFGTFQEELDDVPPVYGVLKPVKTWNPVKINFQHIWGLMQDAWHTRNWKHKFSLWFMPTGWRPPDVVDKHPRPIIEDVYNFTKFHTTASVPFIIWSAFQFLVTLALQIHLLASFGDLTVSQLWVYSIFIFVNIYGYTTLMDRDRYAIWLEIFRSVAGVAVLAFFSPDWFGLNTLIPGGSYLMASYFLATITGAVYFTFIEKQPVTSPEQALPEN